MTTDVTNVMTSVERLLEYTSIEQESSFKTDPGKIFHSYRKLTPCLVSENAITHIIFTYIIILTEIINTDGK